MQPYEDNLTMIYIYASYQFASVQHAAKATSDQRQADIALVYAMNDIRRSYKAYNRPYYHTAWRWDIAVVCSLYCSYTARQPHL